MPRLRPFSTLLVSLLSLQAWAQAPANPPAASASTGDINTTAGKASDEKTLNNKAEIDTDADIVFMIGLPLTKGKDATLSYVRQTYIKAGLVKDSLLREMVKMALAKIEDQPEKAAELRQEHLNKLADYFLKQAQEAQKDKRVGDMIQMAQIAVRCNPANSDAKLFYANVLHRNLGRTDDAIQSLRYGMEFINIDDANGRQYLDFYFRLLQLRERDQEVIDQSLKLLQSSKVIPQSTRETLALAAATSLYWVGKYPDAVNLVSANSLDKYPEGLLLKARALFDGGKTQEAISLLESKSSVFKGPAKDAILSQQARFHILLGQTRIALSVVQERVALDEKAASPRIQRLQLLDKLGMKDDYEKDLRYCFDNLGGNYGAMIALANFAAEKGYDGLSLAVANIATSHGFERATFAALHLEALLNNHQPDQVIIQYQQVTSVDRAFFESNKGVVQALLGIAYYARDKKDPIGTKRDRDIGDRYLAEFLKTKDLGPEAYRSVGRLLKKIRAGDPAMRILETGVQAFPHHSQLRADYISARILAGQTEGYGTRKPLADEIDGLLQMRRPSPAIWPEIISWLHTEAKITVEKARQLEANITPLVRNNLDPEALEGR